jgi:hypothetical protein
LQTIVRLLGSAAAAGRRLLLLLVATGIFVTVSVGLAGTANAATVVPCDSGPPVPIIIEILPGGDNLCFGGRVGFVSVRAQVGAFDSGGYYGRIYFQTERGGEVLNAAFTPHDPAILNVFITAIEITPPHPRPALGDHPLF